MAKESRKKNKWKIKGLNKDEHGFKYPTKWINYIEGFQILRVFIGSPNFYLFTIKSLKS